MSTRQGWDAIPAPGKQDLLLFCYLSWVIFSWISLGYIEFTVKSRLQKLSTDDNIAQYEYCIRKERERKEENVEIMIMTVMMENYLRHRLNSSSQLSSCLSPEHRHYRLLTLYPAHEGSANFNLLSYIMGCTSMYAILCTKLGIPVLPCNHHCHSPPSVFIKH